MGRREWIWAAGTALALLLAGWVSVAGPISAFTPPDQRGPGMPEPGFTLATTEVDNRAGRRDLDPSDGATADLVGSVVNATLKILVLLVVLAVVAAIVLALLRHRRPDPVIPKDDVDAAVLPDVLLAGVRDGEAALGQGTSGEAVINAWIALERAALAVGVDDDASRTPTELVSAVLSEHAVDRRAIETLAGLYREARFSRHTITEQHRDAAREAIHQVRSDLSATLLGLRGETRS